MTVLRLCIHCRHEVMALCHRPLTDRVSLVDGRSEDRLGTLCSNERRDGLTLFSRRQRCGKGAQFFEEMPPPPAPPRTRPMR